MRLLFRAAVLLTLASGAPPTQAQRLAVRRYTSADGLPSDRIHALLYDGAGALWIGTDEGLARFDGQSFRTFGVEEGLPAANVHTLFASRDGELWVGTTSGLAVLPLRSNSSTRFETIQFAASQTEPKSDLGVMAVAESADGSIWAGTTDGLFLLRRSSDQGRSWVASSVPISFAGPVDNFVNRRFVRTLLSDPSGGVWFGGSAGVSYCDPSARCAGRSSADAVQAQVILTLARDENGAVWGGGRGYGLAALKSPQGVDGQIDVRLHRDGMPQLWVMACVQEPGGAMWVATLDGLVAVDTTDASHPRVVVRIGQKNGFPSDKFSALALLPDGVIFTGDPELGLVRWDRRGAETFTFGPNLSALQINVMESTRSGEWVGLSSDGLNGLTQFRAGAFSTVHPHLPSGWVEPWWPTVLQASDRRWWIPTTKGVCIFSPSERIEPLDGKEPERCLSAADGLADSVVFGLFEDKLGDIWISQQRDDPPALSRWTRSTGRIETFPPQSGLPACHFFRAFAQDRAGNVWIGCYAGGLVRYKDHKFERFAAPAGMPLDTTLDLALDRRGRLWASFDNGGVLRCDDPTAAAPVFTKLGKESGLAGRGGGALAIDRLGRVYVANAMGLFRLSDGETRARRFGLEDGFSSVNMRDIAIDADGTLWTVSADGVARLVPPDDRVTAPADPVIVQLRAGGEPVTLPLLGQSQVSGIELPASRANLEVEVTTVQLDRSERFRVQSRLIGVEPEFGPPTEQWSRFYPSLSPGRYEVAIRTVDSSGTPSQGVATVSLQVLAPWWRRSWFVALVGGAIACASFLVHRQRLARRLALERVRLRIATDLHDDLGSSLSSIAIQGDLLVRTAAGLSAAERDRLKRIGASAAEMVETMSDIVWAVNPRFDRLSQLAHRMHRFARETLAPAGIEVEFDDRTKEHDLELDSAARRQLYLIFKELVHNVVRHAGARRVEVSIESRREGIVQLFKDDGRGFDPEAVSGPGLGLESMRRRAASIGATLEIRSVEGGGTEVKIVLAG